MRGAGRNIRREDRVSTYIFRRIAEAVADFLDGEYHSQMNGAKLGQVHFAFVPDLTYMFDVVDNLRGDNLMTQKFGQYLQSVRERDIDLILLEEFHCCVAFVDWFCANVGLENVHFSGAWHSVSNVDGETDLLLCVQHHDRSIGLFIENKIGAPEQDNQDGRYHIRARRAIEDGNIDDYHTMIIAPDRYLEDMRTDHVFMSSVSFEKIEDWFECRDDSRSRWRGAIIREAIEQNRRSNNMIENTTRSRFFEDYWQHLRKHHPTLIMKRPTTKGNKSRWVMFKGPGYGPGIQFTHKCNQCLMELGFSRTSLENFPKDILDNLPTAARAAQVGTKTAFHVDVPEIDLDLPFGAQIGQVESAIDAAYLLLPVFEAWKSKGLSVSRKT